ncbi:CRAL-TRIO domain-containing protein [Jimgerdemannia flammicorona]|uniref:CRAL-TRIO domain-containing protein n=1 Tax=Jimgerdemannia flammicorona TaxID=994334 RepID=A0A433QUF1_9FUNG|nr:CRAL-TRIO domain-containing protein [Jimgerdemannia flammicorona]
MEWRMANKIDEVPIAGDGILPCIYPVRGFTSMPDSNLETVPGISEYVLRIAKYMGGSCLHKVDREGCPLYIERLGYHDAKKLATFTTIEEVVNYHIACNEFLHRKIMGECTERVGHIIHKETVIFDCTNMGWNQFHMPALQFIRAIADIDQKYYPETMNKLYLVNAPSAFVMVWKIVKGWLDPGVIEKIHILGKDYPKVLLEQIPAENLPDFLGGTCTCSHIAGGCVPSHMAKTLPVAPEITVANPNVSGVYTDELVEKSRKAAEAKKAEAAAQGTAPFA